MKKDYNLEQLIEQLIDDLCDRYEKMHKTEILWEALWLDGNFSLIDKLSRAEKHEAGFGTIVVKKEGFSANNRVHNLVLSWLKQNRINTFNPGLEITRLERALYGSSYATV